MGWSVEIHTARHIWFRRPKWSGSHTLTRRYRPLLKGYPRRLRWRGRTYQVMISPVAKALIWRSCTATMSSSINGSIQEEQMVMGCWDPLSLPTYLGLRDDFIWTAWRWEIGKKCREIIPSLLNHMAVGRSHATFSSFWVPTSIYFPSSPCPTAPANHRRT